MRKFVTLPLFITASLVSGIALAQDPGARTPATAEDIEAVHEERCTAGGGEWKLGQLNLRGDVGMTCVLPVAADDAKASQKIWVDFVSGTTTDGSVIMCDPDGLYEVMFVIDAYRVQQTSASGKCRLGSAGGISRKQLDAATAAAVTESKAYTDTRIAETTTRFDQEMAALREQQGQTQGAVDALGARVGAVEERVTTVEGRVTTVEGDVAAVRRDQVTMWTAFNGRPTPYLALSIGGLAQGQPQVAPPMGEFVENDAGEIVPVLDEDGDEVIVHPVVRAGFAGGLAINAQTGIALDGGRVSLDFGYGRIVEQGDNGKGKMEGYSGNLFTVGASGAAQVGGDNSPVGVGGFVAGTHQVSGVNPSGDRVSANGGIVGPLVDFSVPLADHTSLLIEGRAYIGGQKAGLTTVQANGVSDPFDTSGVVGGGSVTVGIAFK